MSSIRYALERLDSAVSRLDFCVNGVEQVVHEQAYIIQSQKDNVIDVDFVAGRLDRAIRAVEHILKEGE